MIIYLAHSRVICAVATALRCRAGLRQSLRTRQRSAVATAGVSQVYNYPILLQNGALPHYFAGMTDSIGPISGFFQASLRYSMKSAVAMAISGP